MKLFKVYAGTSFPCFICRAKLFESLLHFLEKFLVFRRYPRILFHFRVAYLLRKVRTFQGKMESSHFPCIIGMVLLGKRSARKNCNKTLIKPEHFCPFSLWLAVTFRVPYPGKVLTFRDMVPTQQGCGAVRTGPFLGHLEPES